MNDFLVSCDVYDLNIRLILFCVLFVLINKLEN